MSNLTILEKHKLEKLLGMGTGYVLDFNNYSFQEYLLERLGIDIYSEKYNYSSGSKANRLRALWKVEPNNITAKSIIALLEYWQTNNLLLTSSVTSDDQVLASECNKIAERLLQDNDAESIDSFISYSDDKNFSLLIKSLNESISSGQPEATLDRLHTIITRYIRMLCKKHQIPYEKDFPLHSIYGKYFRYLKQNNAIESEMTEVILKSTIDILESFNRVRNNQSLAHDNPLLNYDESLLIFNSVVRAVKFIVSIEQKYDDENQRRNNADIEIDEIPF